jgi:intein/homing endonuclease
MAEYSVFSRLKKLFSTNTIVRNVGGKKLKIADTDQIQSFVNRRGVDRFHRVYNSATGGYGSHHGRYEAAAAFQGARLQLFRDYDMMDCLDGNTIIPLPTGERATIKELSDRFDGTPFYVFSYDQDENSVILGKATNVWSKGIRNTVKITFDNGEYLIVTPEHPIMMRGGTYKNAKDISPNESVMPFYQKEFYSNVYGSIKKETISNLNHKVVSVTPHEEVEVFDMTVDVYHNFATEHCFVHNCDPIVSSVLDIYADESTIKDEFGKILTIKTSNSQIQEILENLFYDILNIEFNLWPWVRNMCKYGDFLLYLDIDSEYGIVNVIPLSVYETVRIEGEEPGNPFSVRFEVQNDFLQIGKKDFDNYEIAHFRLLADTNFLPYGKCLPNTAYVNTEHGLQTINTLKKGQNVWVWNGSSFELSPIKHVVESGTKEIIEVFTTNRSLQTSKNHPILVWDEVSHRTVYKLAENIKIGDFLVVSSNEHLKTTEELDERFAKLIGFLTGRSWKILDGSIIFEETSNLEINLKYTELLKEFNQEVISVYNDLETDISKNRIPQWIFSASQKSKISFIEGIQDAVGGVGIDKWNHNKHFIELPNEMLIRDLQQLLLLLNIKVSEISSKEKNTHYHEKTAVVKYYYISFYLTEKQFSQDKKYDKFLGKYVFTEPVTKIISLDPALTYDIQVESLHSNFIANGIVVHNSMIEGGRRVWKQLQLMEDAMLVHRIMRAPDKRKFKIDIGNIPPNEVDNYMQRMIDKMKKTPLIDPKTGDYNLRYNMMNITEDFYLPVRGRDSGTEIETMQGLQFNAIEDIEYLRNKLMAAFKVPKAFIGYEEDLSGKATLAAQDVRFARTIEKIQRITVSELTKLAVIHLYVQGFRDAELVNFELSLPNSSTLYEQEKISIWKERFFLAQQMTGGQATLLSQDWVYKHIFEMSDGQIEEQRKLILEDMKRSQEQMAASQPGALGGMPGNMGGAPVTPPMPPPGADQGSVPEPDQGSDQEADIDSSAETQIDDVDEILQRLDDMDFNETENDESLFSEFDGEEPSSDSPDGEEFTSAEDEQELREQGRRRKVGRPPEGLKFKTDNHPLGRDPFGNKENTKIYKRKSLSMETKNLLDKIKIGSESNKKIVL